MYFAGPAADPAALDRAALALILAGFEVTAANTRPTTDAVDLIAQVADGLDADAVVILPRR